MTEKMIVNGVDVSGCKHCKHIYKNGEGECAAYFLENEDSTVSCSEFPNCYYKQMKKLEQENQELGKIIDCKNGTIASLAKVRDELKEELDKIFEIVDENRITAQYKGICTSILMIIRGEEDE